MTRNGWKELIGFVVFVFIILILGGWFTDDVDQRCETKHGAAFPAHVTICD